jgi:GT2 family glycosyltransferase
MGSGRKIGVVTVTYNSASVIGDFIESLLGQSHTEFIAYVIDNASSDDTLKRLMAYDDSRLVLVDNPTNVGVAEGNNIGIRAALRDGCDYVLLINNDTVFDSNLVSELLEGLRRYECDMAVPKILYFDDPGKIWCAGGYFSRLRGSARHFGRDRKDDGKFDRPCAVSYSPTCCMLMRKSVFDKIGFMDANYFVYFDDTDFCYRAYRAGLKLFYLPTGRLLHKVSSLTGGESDFYYSFTIRNHAYYLLKHSPPWQIPFYFLAYQVHLLAKFIFLLRKPKTFLLAESAFWQGISLFYSREEQQGDSARAAVVDRQPFLSASDNTPIRAPINTPRK